MIMYELIKLPQDSYTQDNKYIKLIIDRLFKQMLGDINSQTFIHNLLEQGVRLDGRELFQNRQIKIQFMDKKGCLLYSLGMTQIMIKISTEITMPKPERPSEGIVNFRVNCMACSHSIQQNKKNSNQILNLLQKIVIGSHSLDPESLCILTGKYVWQVIIDCIVVRDSGNMIDAVLNGVMAALMDMRKPLVSVEKQNVVVGQKLLPLSIAHIPLALTFGLVQNSIFLDPSSSEQKCSQTRVTISINIYNEICLIHKPGGKSISQNILSGMIKVCQKNIKQLTNIIRKCVQRRQSVRSLF